MKNLIEAIHYAEEHINVYNWNEALEDYTVVAFGLGKFFEDTHERLYQMCNVEYLSDNSEEKWGKIRDGRTIISPESI